MIIFTRDKNKIIPKFYRTHFDCHKKCPVKNCDGWYTTSKSENLVNHLLNRAKTEVFTKKITGNKNFNTPHFDYIFKQKNIKNKVIQKILI